MDASTLSLTIQNQSSGNHLVSLSCPVGKIHFQNDEFHYYKYLYETVDLDDDGRISFKDGNVLLMRSKVPKKILSRAWGTVSKHKNDDIVLEQWLLLCKVLAHIQSHQNETTDLEIMLRTTSLLQLFLSTTVSALELPYRSSSSSSSSSSLDIDVIGWREIGEGIQKFVIYQIRYVTSLLCFSKLEWEVSRRYSDFKFLADRLSRYEGALVPPLPPKQMINSLYQDLPVQRSQELSLFLKNIARHPVLFGVLEFRIFLEASQKGFDSFKQMIRTLPECESIQQFGSSGRVSPTKPSSPTSTVTAASTAAVGYAWGMLSSMNKMMGLSSQLFPSSTLPPPKILDEVLENRYNYTIILLQALASATTKIGNLIDIDHKRYHELSRIGHYLKQAGNLEGNRPFDRVLLTASKSIEYLLLDGPKTLDLESLEVYFHLQNISRFQSVLEKNKASRDQLWSLKQVEDASLLKSRDSLATIRLSQTRDAEGLRRAENKVSEGEETVQKMEKRLNDVNNATKRDLQWLNQVTKFELQGRIFGFVQMRIASCQREVESWERLQSDLLEEASQPLFHYEEEDEEESEFTGAFL